LALKASRCASRNALVGKMSIHKIFASKKIIIIPVLVALLSVGGYLVILPSASRNVDEVPASGSLAYERIASTTGPALECALDPAEVPLSEPPPDGIRPNYLHTCGNRILDSYGRDFQMVGITWSGMEYPAHSPLGLYTRNWQEILDQITSLSYNTIRLPYTNDMLQSGVAPQRINYELNPDLEGLSAIEVLDRLVQGARQRGLRVILDRHRPTSAAQSPLWYTREVPEEQWIRDWQMLARRYLGNDTVIAADLHNEPHGDATWGTGDKATDWRMAAEVAGNAILSVNPYLLVFVQGVDRQGNSLYWWGGDLRGVANFPVQLTVPNRVVYSPRDYGPEVYNQEYFSDPTFPENLPNIWDQHWGYIHRQGISPVVLGELGGTRLDDSVDGRWKRTLLHYLQVNRIGFINWSLDRSTFDDQSALERDTRTTILDTGRLYRASMSIPDEQVESTTNPVTTSLKVLHKTEAPNEQPDTISFAVKVRNGTSSAVDLSRLEMRYWFTPGELGNRSQRAHVEWANQNGEDIHVEIVYAVQNSRQSYLRVTFDQSAGRLAPFSDSGEIQVKVRKSDGSKYAQINDYSYSPSVDFEEQRQITLYLDGQLIWGVEP